MVVQRLLKKPEVYDMDESEEMWRWRASRDLQIELQRGLEGELSLEKINLVMLALLPQAIRTRWSS